MMNKKFKYVNVDVLIGEKTTLTGDLVSESAIKIDGTVCGNIRTTREVILTQTAQVEGDIYAASLILSGHLLGNARAEDQLLIKETGVLEGNIETGSLVIEEGGRFFGMNQSLTKEKAPQSPAADEEVSTEQTNLNA